MEISRAKYVQVKAIKYLEWIPSGHWNAQTQQQKQKKALNLSGFLNIRPVFISARKFNLLNFLDVSKD